MKIVAIVFPLMISVAYLTYFERKVIGFMQGRIGPNRVGYFGLLQPIADAFKLMFKEIISPTKSNNFLFLLAPILLLHQHLLLGQLYPLTQNLFYRISMQDFFMFWQ